MSRIFLKERGAFGNAETGGAWLSLARFIRFWVLPVHVEAPMAGSIILAGIALKLETYGFLRFSIPMFPEATLCSTPFIYTLSAIAIIYTSSTTLRQVDLKKNIAYSSVAHMNLVTIGMFIRAVAVRSPILSYGHTRTKHV
ncbi:NADH:ubiquinone dehydrogenase subunit 4 [Datura stramonium]|uniref:NADH-ubiquinone oxidoreductase chain 4 n=1 Tax=Datura stramonium TaxID=4076 RepID=A0ABS8Y5R8_DATST|nr:NADH:ubiquinone dehydrogenase subunit 4 [Datura stramonium]